MKKYAQDLLAELPGYYDVEITRTNRTGQVHGANIHGRKANRLGNYEIRIHDPLNTEYRDLFGYDEQILSTDGSTIEQAIYSALEIFDRLIEYEGIVYYSPDEVRSLMRAKYGPLLLTDLSREIRVCTPDWVHTIGKYGWPIPLDGPRFREAMDNWILEAKQIEGAIPDVLLAEKPTADQFMPRVNKNLATAYQVYETATDGTPISPVLLSRAAICNWFVSEGYDKKSVIEFSSTWAREADHKGVIWPTKEHLDAR